MNKQALYQPQPRYDVLRLPGIGRLLRWRWGRLLFQIPLLLLAALMIYDGLTGPQLAPQNIATTAAWIQYRGLIVLVLLLAGNLFCMGCPFALPRTLATRISGYGRRWPRVLRNKWLAIGSLFAIFWLYEWLDLWASPWLTAWLAIAYFIAAFALEALFAESPFCKYICPLGSFNFVSSTISPWQISVQNHDVCRACVGKECVNGSDTILGCGTELFAPQVQSNMDCLFCLGCARACPHDNVILAARSRTRELTTPGAWPRRWDLAFLVMVFTFASISNAFGMVPPFYALQAWLANWLPINNEAVLLLLIFGVGILLFPAAICLGAAWCSRQLSGTAGHTPLRVAFTRYAPAFVPLGFAVWLAHYGFHFATGALAIIPVFQNFLLDHGLTWLGQTPNWQMSAILPGSWLLPLQTIIVLAGFGGSLYVANEIGRQAHKQPQTVFKAILPWALVFLALALAALATFNLPMEMRGTIQFNP